jgi:hypothetical protein
MEQSTNSQNDKKKCTNCKCWRDPNDFVGAKGNEVKRCQKCRAKDAKSKQRPEVVEKRKELQKEKKYYIAYREKKKEEDEEAFKKHNAEVMKQWRNNNKEQVTAWRKQNYNYKMKGIREQAISKGIQIEEGFFPDIAVDLMKQNCFYCCRNDSSCVNGIDRMDNSKGYNKLNCVPCCKYCNFIKKALDAHTFVERCVHIATCFGHGTTKYEASWLPSNRVSFTAYKKRAIQKNLDFEIDEVQFTNICNQPCFYCHRENTLLQKNGVDSVDNSKGYTLDNCVSCCGECNRMKSDMDKDMFINTCIAVAARQSEIKLPEMQRCLCTQVRLS